jgi:DNA-binding beta-propeller fold protein YncE
VANTGKNGAKGDTVTPISTATDTAGKPIKVGPFPSLIAITSNGKTAYVTGPGDVGGGDTVTPITTATNTPGKPIRVGRAPDAIVITR